MTSFDLSEPLLPPYPETVGMQDLNGLLKAHAEQQQAAHPGLARLLQFPALSLSFSFSQLDQAFLVWGAIALAIFSLAQFGSMSWMTQSLLDAALTGIGIVSTSKLTWRIACSERLKWVVCLWAVLMMGGMIATAYGIFCSSSPSAVLILLNLCPLWLGLCAVGYLAMSIGLQSRCFGAASGVHGAAIAALSLYPHNQFLMTGLVMALTLFFFSVVPWDMRAAEAEELCGLQIRELEIREPEIREPKISH